MARYLMLVLACLALPAQDLGAGAENTAVIAGTVVDSLTGVGIRKAEVRLNRLNGRPPADIYLTDNAGRFEAAGLNPGIYQLRVSRNGFVVPKWTKIVDTAQPEAREVVLKLTPQGVITGRVTDADGDPLDGVTIQLLRRQNYAGQTSYDAIRHEATDDLGEYRLAGLTTGRYFVAAERADVLSLPRSSSEGATAFARTFYPAATSPENAIWLDVKPGVELRQIDVRMERLPVVQVKGRITNADQVQREKLSLSLIPAAGEMAMLQRITGFMDSQTGGIEFRNVFPGAYDLTAAMGRELTAVRRIEVGPGGLENVSVTLSPPFAIRGRVEAEGASPSALAGLAVLLRARIAPRIIQAPVSTEGTFESDPLSPDRYQVHLSSVPVGWYLHSVRVNGQLSRDLMIDATNGPPADLHLTFRQGWGSIKGSATMGTDPARGAHITLVPAGDERDRVELYRRTIANEIGVFTFDNIAPGTYRVFAWQQLESSGEFDWDLQDAHEADAKTVTVEPNAQALVELVAIRAEPGIEP